MSPILELFSRQALSFYPDMYESEQFREQRKGT